MAALALRIPAATAAERCVSASLPRIPQPWLAAAAGLIVQFLAFASISVTASLAAALGRAAAAARSYQLDRRWRGYLITCM